MKKALKPRNPLVSVAKFRKAGVHEKPAKARRQAHKQALRKAIKQDGDVGGGSCRQGVQSAHPAGRASAGRLGIAGQRRPFHRIERRL